MYREQIKVLDCTIRDGGLVNDHRFSDDFVRTLYRSLSTAGVDYMEFGYRNSKKLVSVNDFGPWKFCDDDKISEVIDGIESEMKISIMVDAHRVVEQEFRPVNESPVDMIRVATYVKDIDKAIVLNNRVRKLGYETTVNIMAISTESEFDLVQALKQLAEIDTLAVYVVDSYGSLYSEQIEYYIKLYQEHLPGKEIGVHCHNNQQLAFGNTIEGIIHNANFLDASVYGMGRGAGNCTLELLLGFLKNPKFKLAPVLKFVQDYMLPMREQYEWGYLIPFMVTGILNEHPRSGIACRQSEDKDKFMEFYEDMLESSQ